LCGGICMSLKTVFMSIYIHDFLRPLKPFLEYIYTRLFCVGAFVCIHIHTLYVCPHLYMCIYTPVNVHVWGHLHVYIHFGCICTRLYVYMSTDWPLNANRASLKTVLWVYIHVCMCIYTLVNVHVYIHREKQTTNRSYIYIYMHTQTDLVYTCTRTHKQNLYVCVYIHAKHWFFCFFHIYNISERGV